MNRLRIVAPILLALGLTGFAVWVLSNQGPANTGVVAPSAAPSKAKTVKAEGRVVPAQHSRLSFKVSGKIAQIYVQEGQRLSAGEPIAKLETKELELSVTSAEAALDQAKSELARLEAGSREEDITIAEANLQIAEAKLAALIAGPTPGQIEVATKRIEETKNALWAEQIERDGICGGGSPDWQCQRGNARVGRAHSAVELAEAQRTDLLAPPRQHQLDLAEAEIATARAKLDLTRSPYRQADLDTARAKVAQAESALAQVKEVLSQALLKAPYEGTVAEILIHPGEVIQAGAMAIVFADLDHLQVETTDMDEIGAALIAINGPAITTVQALEGETFPGRVIAIAPKGTITSGGDVHFTITVLPERQHPALRWGMTTKVTFPVD